MVLGDRSTLDKDLEAAMQNTGLTHLTAVSGANCGYLLAFVFLTARSARLPRAVASAAGVLALVGFVLVVRPDASVLRAAVMGGLGTLAVLSGRGKLPAALLCLSITVLLAVDPWLSGSYAFILSVLATSGLILLGPRLTELLSRRMPWPLAAALAVPLAAQLFCSPVLVLLQPQVPVYSLPANIVAAPVIPLVTVAGMAAAVLTAALPPLAAPLLLVAGAGAAWTSFVARFFSSLPGALLPWPGGATGVMLMAGAGVAVIWVVLRAGKAGSTVSTVSAGETANASSAASAGRPRGRGGPAVDLTAAVPLAVALLLLPPAAVAAWTYLMPGPAPPGWSAVVCDVGQGDGLVVRTAEHSALVIDAGPDPEAMDGCLNRLGVKTVDLLILTHAHLDHYGGTEGVLRQREVHRIAFSTAEAELPPQLDAHLKGSGAELTRLTAGMSAQTGPVKWDVLWPPKDSQQATENDASAVVLVSLDPDPDAQPAEPRLTMLLTGDIEQDAALALLSRNAWLRTDGVDVLKVPHHGARNGGTALITQLRPRVALISVGADNDYGHPGPAILSALEDTGTTVARTDLLGSISLDMDGKTLRVGGLDGR
nr:ComEC/Rec2 family competence protein [Arthrobacter jiangjiafuii]